MEEHEPRSVASDLSEKGRHGGSSVTRAEFHVLLEPPHRPSHLCLFLFYLTPGRKTIHATLVHCFCRWL